MDIDEMKKNWVQLNQRLERSEKVNHEAIRKLLADKAVGGYDKIRRQERKSLISCLLLLFMFPLMYVQGIINNWLSFALLEFLMVIGLIYTLSLQRTMPKSIINKEGLVGMIKGSARYVKLYTYFGPIQGCIIILVLALFFCSIGEGYQNDTYHKTIFYGSLTACLIIFVVSYIKKKETLKAINRDLEELRKFEMDQ